MDYLAWQTHPAKLTRCFVPAYRLTYFDPFHLSWHVFPDNSTDNEQPDIFLRYRWECHSFCVLRRVHRAVLCPAAFPPEGGLSHNTCSRWTSFCSTNPAGTLVLALIPSQLPVGRGSFFFSPGGVWLWITHSDLQSVLTGLNAGHSSQAEKVPTSAPWDWPRFREGWGDMSPAGSYSAWRWSVVTLSLFSLQEKTAGHENYTYFRVSTGERQELFKLQGSTGETSG